MEAFSKKHAQARKPLSRWYRTLLGATWKTPQDILEVFQSAEYVDPHTIFDIGGNKYRLIAIVDRDDQSVLIEYVMTHEQYDRWNKS